jgi:23S rRNA pseudouridine1911/1915/1917 synthase
VFPPHGDPSGDCVLRWWRGQRALGAFPPGFEGGLAHRLDVSTSGVLLACHDAAELERARGAFAGKRLHKTYRLLSSGQVDEDRIEVDLPVAHDRRRRDRMVVQRGPRTRHRGRWYPARTRFRRIQGRLWEAVIETGVMHQIRVHAASVGLPLDGDRIYGGAELVGAPQGVDFALHHARMGGWGACPFCPPPGWWPI